MGFGVELVSESFGDMHLISGHLDVRCIEVYNIVISLICITYTCFVHNVDTAPTRDARIYSAPCSRLKKENKTKG